MRAAAIEAFGGPGALLIHSLPVPVPAAGEVLIATNTAVGARIRRFSVGDAVYAAGFPNPLEGGGHQRWAMVFSLLPGMRRRLCRRRRALAQGTRPRARRADDAGAHRASGDRRPRASIGC